MKEDDGLTVREITAGGTQMLASNSSSHVIKLNLITDDIISIFSIYILCDTTQAYILFPVNSRPIFGETEKKYYCDFRSTVSNGWRLRVQHRAV